MLKCQKELRSRANKEDSILMGRFFKTGPGQYGEGDVFLGGTNTPTLKLMAKENQSLSFKEIESLLSSKFHEERALGLKILVIQYEKSKKLSQKKKIVDFYLAHYKSINNWDLVDMSAYDILGDYSLLTNNDLIFKMSEKKFHFAQRIAVVSSLALIRAGKHDVIYQLSKKFFNSPEDLMHKACGWMLRESGKRDEKRLLKFIEKEGTKMPRTMLRYSIEKFPHSVRQEILKSTKS